MSNLSCWLLLAHFPLLIVTGFHLNKDFTLGCFKTTFLQLVLPTVEMSTSKRAFVLGASGAVGSRLVEVLVASKQFSRVVLMGRRNIDTLPQSDILEQKVVDFENIEQNTEDFKDLDIGFCALGTTRAKAGAKGFYKVDHDYVVNTAKVAKEQGVKEFMLVTSMGSNEDAFFLYPKTKGETERDVAALGFDKFLIARPGFLENRGGDFRLGECVANILLAPVKLFSNSVAISTENVAKALVVGSLSTDLSGKVIWENAELLKKASEFEANTSKSSSE